MTSTLICHNCGTADIALQVCSGCKQVSYCSKLCQKDDWKKTHKESCMNYLKLVTVDPKKSPHHESDRQKKSANSSEKECANCGVQRTHLSICSRCKLTPYCCVACQLQHWSAIGGHKKICISLFQRQPGAVLDSDIAGEVRCAICQESLLVRLLSVLKCSHAFHSDCLTDLRKSNIAQICPVCRLSFGDAKGAKEAIANPDVSNKVKETLAALLDKANTALRYKDYEKAAFLFDAVLVQESSNEMALFCKALIAQESNAGGGVNEASRCYIKLLQLNPKHTAAHYNYGNLLKAQGKLVEAAEHYNAALKIEPNYADAHSNYGNLLMAQGKLVKAAEHYEAALKIDPNHADAHYNYGCLLMAQRKLEEAAEHYEAALKIDPYDADAHSNYGCLLTVQSKLVEAAEHYEAALKIDPNHADAHSNYGSLLKAQGKHSNFTTLL